jgi:hypothetical protein
MKVTNTIKNTMSLLAAATFAGLSGNALAQDKATGAWNQIGEAPGVVAMAGAEEKLFAITGSKKLQVCDPSTTPVAWKEIGDGPGGNVVAMGVSDGKIFASTDARSAGRLARRDATTSEASWQDQGHAWCLVGMAGAPGKMYAICDTKEVGAEPTVMVRDNAGKATENAGRGLDGIPWNGVDRRPPLGALALAEVGGKYFVATKEDALYEGNPTKTDVKWEQIGDAAGVTILAGNGSKLFAVTKLGKLMVWESKASK